MDDLRLNRTVAPPHSSGAGNRVFVLAIAIAAGLHLLVFGALAFSSGALSSRSHKAAPFPAPVAASTAAQPATAVSPPAPIPTPAMPPQPIAHPHPVAPMPASRDRLVVPHHVHPVPASKPPKRRKPAAQTKPSKTRMAKPKPSRPTLKHAPTHARAKPALDLNALSHFKSSGR